MIVPSKTVLPDQALLTIGAQILMQLHEPGTVSAVWERLSLWRSRNAMPSSVPFWWFALGLDVLYALGVIELSDGLISKVHHAV